MSLGRELRAARKRKGLSGLALAKAIGVSKASIYRYEWGTQQPTVDGLVKLADVLDASIDSLLSRRLATIPES